MTTKYRRISAPTRAEKCPVPAVGGVDLSSGSQLETGNWKLLCDPLTVQRAWLRAPFDHAARTPAVRNDDRFPVPTQARATNRSRRRPEPQGQHPSLLSEPAAQARGFSCSALRTQNSGLSRLGLCSPSPNPRVSRPVVKLEDPPCASPGIPVALRIAHGHGQSQRKESQSGPRLFRAPANRISPSHVPTLPTSALWTSRFSKIFSGAPADRVASPLDRKGQANGRQPRVKRRPG